MGAFLFIIVVVLILAVVLTYAVRRGSTQKSRSSEGDSVWFCDWGGSDSADRPSHHDSPHQGGADSGGSHHGGFDGGANHGAFDSGGFDGGGGPH